MKFKICFIFALVFCFLPTICNAKSIVVNRVLYNVNNTLDMGYFIYNPDEDTLTIKNANLSMIKTEEQRLRIVLEGNNTISNTYIIIKAIEAGDIEITINSSINSIESNGDINIYQASLTASASNKVFKYGNNELYLDNSNLFVYNADILVDELGYDAHIINSNIYVLDCNHLKPLPINDIERQKEELEQQENNLNKRRGG